MKNKNKEKLKFEVKLENYVNNCKPKLKVSKRSKKASWKLASLIK